MGDANFDRLRRGRIARLVFAFAWRSRSAPWSRENAGLIFIADISPTNATQVFRAVISWKDGKPEISWKPDLNEGGTRHERVYRKFGKVQLTDKDWTLIDDGDEADFNFFKVSVEMK